MNERIRELTRQVVIAMRAEKTDLPPLDSVVLDKIMELREDYDKKFAELIVKECADLIDNKEIITAAQTYDDVFVASYNAREECSNQIKQHFGVQE